MSEVTPAEFFAELYGDDAPGYRIIFTLPGADTFCYPASDVSAAAGCVERVADNGHTYYGVGLQHKPPTSRKSRGDAAGVIALPGVWEDIDIRHPVAHADDRLPPTRAAAMELLTDFPLPPSVLVDSGFGYQAYWLLDRLWVFDDNGDAHRAAELSHRFQRTFAMYAERRGWRIDSTHDLARVLRVPGSWNLKVADLPVAVFVADWHPERRYSVDELESHLLEPEARRTASPVGDAIHAGERNATLASLAGSMTRRGMTADAIEAALLVENVAKCDPPLPEDEVRAVAASVGRYAPKVETDEVGLFVGTLAALLDDVEHFLARFVTYPTTAARVAHALWIAHAHAVEAFESTPRLAFLSPEKGSGKTRALEVMEGLVPKPMHAVNCTAAALFRAVSARQPTLLFDECDTYFGPRVAQQHEELRGLVNAGHRRGAVAYRCVGEPAKMEVREFPAFCAVALAGLGDLPDTILDRSIVIHMKRRAPHETIEPFRLRQVKPVAMGLRQQLAAWAKSSRDALAEAEPVMPSGITDRPADVWEPLLSIADAAGGDWPTRARAAALELTAARQHDPSLGVRLLADVRDAFGVCERLFTETVLECLTELDEAPWGDLRGRKLDARGLARRLRRFGIAPRQVRVGETTKKGYVREDFVDAWERYLPASLPQERETRETAEHGDDVTDVSDVSLFQGRETESRPRTPAAAMATHRRNARLDAQREVIAAMNAEADARASNDDEDGA